MRETNRKRGLTIVLGYFLLRMALDAVFWTKISPYYSYLVEVGFVILGLVLYRTRELWKGSVKLADVGLSFVLLIFGALIYLTAMKIEIGVPYDLTDRETIFFLLIVAPVLEEFIFRGVIWEALGEINFPGPIQLIMSTVLFSLGHLMAYFVVPEAILPFVLYQSIYVIGLSLVICVRRMMKESVWGSVLLHFGFNFGFYLASLL